MVFEIQYHVLFSADVHEIIQWYSLESEFVAKRFLVQLEWKLESIIESPKLFVEINKGYRKASLQDFPYSVYFEIHRNKIKILTIVHHSRHPSTWKKRKR